MHQIYKAYGLLGFMTILIAASTGFAQPEKALQLQKTICVSGTETYVAEYQYDQQNRLKALLSTNLTGYDNIENITYDDKNRITGCVEKSQEDNTVSTKKVEYSADGKQITLNISFVEFNQTVSYQLRFFIEDGKIVKYWQSQSDRTVPIEYDRDGHVKEEAEGVKDSLGYTNPNTLVGDRIFWAILRDGMSLDSDSSYVISMAAVPKQVEPITGELAQVAGGKKYPAKAVIPGTDDEIFTMTYQYRVVEKK